MNQWKHQPRKRKTEIKLNAIGAILLSAAIGAMIWVILSVAVAHYADLIDAAHFGDYIGALATPQHYECPTRSC